MIARISSLASSRWWAALAIALAIFTVARTNTVDAPADAMTFDAGLPERSEGIAGIAAPSLDRALSEGGAAGIELDQVRYLWTLESEVRALEAELAVARERARLLQESYSALERKFMHLTSSLPLAGIPADGTTNTPNAPAGANVAGDPLGRNPR